MGTPRTSRGDQSGSPLTIDRQLFDALPLPATLVDAAGLIADLNQAFLDRARSLGFDLRREDRIGRPLAAFAGTAAGRRLVRDLLEDAFDAGRVVRRRQATRGPEGRRLWENVWARAVRDPAGRAVGAVIVREDVTGQVLAERRKHALAELRHRLGDSLAAGEPASAAPALYAALTGYGLDLHSCALHVESGDGASLRSYFASADGVVPRERPVTPGELRFGDLGTALYRPDAGTPSSLAEAIGGSGADGSRCWLELPIARGAVVLSSGVPDAFSADDNAVARELASVLSDALDRHHLRQSLEAHRRQLSDEIARRDRARRDLARELAVHEAVNVVRRPLASMETPRDFYAVLREVGRQLGRLGITHQSVSVQIVNAAGDDFLCFAWWEGRLQLDGDLPDLRSLDWPRRSANAEDYPWVVEVWRSGRTRYVPCTPEGGPLDAGMSVVDAPFSHGTLGVNDLEPEAFSKADIAVVERFAAALSEGFQRFLDRIEARATQEELARSRERLELAVRGAGGGIWDLVIDPERPGELPDEMFLSDELKALLGFAPDELPGSRSAWAARVPEADLRRLHERARDHLEGRTSPFEVEYPIRHRDGSLRWLRSQGEVQRDARGRPVRWTGIARDVTDDHRLRQRDQLLGALRHAVWDMRGSDDVRSVIETLANGLVELGVPFAVCGVNIVRGAGAPPLACLYSRHRDGHWLQTDELGAPEGAATVRRFWRHGAVVYRPDLRRHDPHNEARRVSHLFGLPVRCIADVPFSHGTLAVNSTEPDAFSPADLDLFRDLARVLGEAFRRADDLRALEERNRQLEEQVAERERAERSLRRELAIQAAESAVRLCIATMERPGDLARVVEVISRHLLKLGVPFDNCTVQVVNASGTDFVSVGVPLAADEPPPELATLLRHGLQWPASGDNARLYPWVLELWRTGGVRHVPDRPAAGPLAGCALVNAGFSHGTLAINNRGPHAFDDGHVDLLRRFARLLSEGFRRFVDLLERHRAEHRLQASEERFRRLAERARDIVFSYRLVEPRGFDYVSPAVAGITGYSPEAFYADPDLVWKIVHPRDRPLVRRWVADPATEDPLYLRGVHVEGHTFWIEGRTAPIRDGDGTVVAVQGIARDVTTQRRQEIVREARLAVREHVWAMTEERHFVNVLSAVRDGLCRLDIAFDHVSINIVDVVRGAVYCHYLDGEGSPHGAGDEGAGAVTAIWSARRVAYRRDLTRDDPFDEARRLARLFGAPIRCALDVPFSHGTLGLNSRRAAAFSDDDVAFLGLLAETLSDGFRRLDDLRELRASEDRYRALVETPDLLVLLLDGDGDCLYVNPQVVAFTGVAADRFHAGALDDLVHPDDAAVQRTVLGGRGRRAEVRWRTPAGERWVALSVFPLPADAGGDGLVQVVARDVTERRRAQALQQEFAERLVDVQERERRRVARELHDGVNQVLAAAATRVRRVEELASAGQPLDDHPVAVRRYLGEAIDEVRRIARDLRPAVLDDLGLPAALRSLASRPGVDAQTRVEVHTPPAGPSLPGEVETALYRIAQEALTNAGRHAQARRVDIDLRSCGAFVCLTITDDGVGFDRDLAGAGNGVGLQSMAERARQVEGRFAVETSPGRGTSITVTVPGS